MIIYKINNEKLMMTDYVKRNNRKQYLRFRNLDQNSL